MMHHIEISKFKISSFFKNSKFAIFILKETQKLVIFDIEENIFYYKKGSDLYFSEKYILVFICRKFLDIYLMKI